MYSFVIKISIDLIRAVLRVTKKPSHGLSYDNVDDVTAEADPIKIAVMKKVLSFHLNFYFFFLQLSVSILK